MDSHFSNMLDMQGRAAPQAPFLPSKTFNGAKPGYYFSNGEQGIGYYIDRKNRANIGVMTVDDPNTIPAVGSKRKFDASQTFATDNDVEDIDAYIANAELNNKVEALTADTLQQVTAFISYLVHR